MAQRSPKQVYFEENSYRCARSDVAMLLPWSTKNIITHVRREVWWDSCTNCWSNSASSFLPHWQVYRPVPDTKAACQVGGARLIQLHPFNCLIFCLRPYCWHEVISPHIMWICSALALPSWILEFFRAGDGSLPNAPIMKGKLSAVAKNCS